MSRVASFVGMMAFFCTFSANADVLYKGQRAIALGKGVEEKGIIHWTYCDGTKGDFKKPPHKYVTGEHCKIGLDAFGIAQKDGNYFVEDSGIFRDFFPDGTKGDKVKFSTDGDAVRMDYKGESLVLYRSGNHKAKDPQ
jgi:hypothetical protein